MVGWDVAAQLVVTVVRSIAPAIARLILRLFGQQLPQQSLRPAPASGLAGLLLAIRHETTLDSLTREPRMTCVKTVSSQLASV